MTTAYPTGLDALTNPVAANATTTPSHAAQHSDANDAIEAIEAELGLSPSSTFATVRARLDVVPEVVNARTYGWLGDGSDDSTALQNAATAAIAKNGTLFVPAPSSESVISTPISLRPASGTSFKLNMVSETPIPFRWSGTPGASMWDVKGWKNSRIDGMGVRTSIAGAVIWDLDADSTYTSMSHLTFRDTVVSFGAGGNCVGWRGNISGGNYDLSSFHFDTCLALGTDRDNGDIGWQNLSQNGLVWNWTNMSALTLHTPFTNALARTTLNGAIDAVVTTLTVASTANYPAPSGKVVIGTERISYTGFTATTFTGCTRGVDGTTAAVHSDAVTVTQYAVATTGGASMRFLGASTSSTWKTFVFEAAGAYYVNGRFESNKRFIQAGGAGGGTYPVSVMAEQCEVSTPSLPTDNIIFALNAGVNLTIDGGWYHNADYTADFVNASSAGGAAWGSVLVRNAQIRSQVASVLTVPATSQWRTEYKNALRLSAELTPAAWFV